MAEGPLHTELLRATRVSSPKLYEGGRDLGAQKGESGSFHFPPRRGTGASGQTLAVASRGVVAGAFSLSLSLSFSHLRKQRFRGAHVRGVLSPHANTITV